MPGELGALARDQAPWGEVEERAGVPRHDGARPDPAGHEGVLTDDGARAQFARRDGARKNAPGRELSGASHSSAGYAPRGRRRRRLALVALLLLALAAAGAAGWYFLAPGRAASSEETLILHGNVDIREVRLGFRVAGRIAEMRVEEGDRVEAGDVLAKLDPVPLRQDVALAEAELAGARAALAKMEAGSRPEEIAQAEALVAEREASLVNARAGFKRQSQLVERGVASASAYDDAQARVTEAEAALASSRQALELARAGFREEDIASARASLRASEAQLAQTRTRLEDATLRAPSAGVILTRIEEEGAIVGVGEPVYTLALTSPVWVRAYVPEPELGRVRPGQPAEVTNDSAPGRVYHGQVGFVSPVAEFTPKTVETPELRTDLVYRLRVVVTDADERLRQGMPVTVRLQARSGGTS